MRPDHALYRAIIAVGEMPTPPCPSKVPPSVLEQKTWAVGYMQAKRDAMQILKAMVEELEPAP